jgi:hypothetical protein
LFYRVKKLAIQAMIEEELCSRDSLVE